MSDFQKLIEAEGKDGHRLNDITVQGQPQENARKLSSRLFVFGFAGLVLSGAAFCFWPTLKGSGKVACPAVETTGDMSLSGILYAEDNPSAVVNGKIVSEGDVIDGVQVGRIFRDKVEFEDSGKRWSQSPAPMAEGAGSGLPMLLQLGSHGCPPCRKMMPVLNKLKRKYAGKFRITFIDVWRDRATGAKYGVRAIPTQVFYDGQGRELFRHVGYYSEDEIVVAWKRLGVKL